MLKKAALKVNQFSKLSARGSCLLVTKAREKSFGHEKGWVFKVNTRVLTSVLGYVDIMRREVCDK